MPLDVLVPLDAEVREGGVDRNDRRGNELREFRVVLGDDALELDRGEHQGPDDFALVLFIEGLHAAAFPSARRRYAERPERV